MSPTETIIGRHRAPASSEKRWRGLGLSRRTGVKSGGRLVITTALSLGSTTVVTAGLGFVFWALAAHLTTTEVVGRSSAVISAMQLIATFGTLGLHTLLIAELPGHNGSEVKRLVVTSLGIAGGVGFAVAAGYAFVYHIATGTSEWIYTAGIGVVLFGVGTAVTTVTIVLDFALIGVQRNGRQVSRNLIFSLVKLLALPVAALTVGMSPQVVFSVWLFGNLVSLLILGLRVKTPRQWLKTTPALRGLVPIWRTAAGHHWVNVATQAPRLAMPIMVAAQLSDQANAAFYAALLLASFVWIVPNHLAIGMFALSNEDPQHFGRGLDTALRLSGVVSVLAAAGSPVLAYPLLAIFGPGYVEARFCLIALMTCTFASAVKAIYIAVRRAQSMLGKAARAAAIGAALELGAAELGLKLGSVTGIGLALGAAMALEAVFLWPIIHNARRRSVQQSRGPQQNHNDDGQEITELGISRDVGRRSNAVLRSKRRILVDHSGYALLNIGDIAMLQACVRRLRTLWPDAEIHVFTESPERLEQHCPGTIAVAPTIVGRKGASVFSVSVQLAAEQMWKTAMPLLARSKRDLADVDLKSVRPRLLEAIRRADLVVSSGGGFVNDVFWWHGAGVLSVLAMAQRLGKPTAMFGQGIGPLSHPLLSHLVKLTMPRLLVVGLREGSESVPLLRAHRVPLEHIHVTGDDALLSATRAARPRTGTAIGLNVRVASYSGIDANVCGQVVAVTRQAASRRGAIALPLPVSRYDADSDLHAIRNLSTDPEDNASWHEFADIETPAELAERVARCRVVVTGSYHAAVFGLAAGIPAICISNSRYYDGKFRGLVAQFPGGCHLLRPGPLFERELSEAIDRAWETGEVSRDAIHSAALEQVAKGDLVYQRFKSLADARAKRASNFGENNVARKRAPMLTNKD